MPIQAVENLRLYRQIADQLTALIDTGEYPVGGRLPAERVLAEQLKVSRSSVREALIALEVEGWIEIRGGTGVFVIERRTGRAHPPVETSPGPFEILDARQLVEPETAALAARHARPSDIGELSQIIAMMVSGDDHRSNSNLEADRAFHGALARIGGNGALALLVQTLWEYRQGPLYLRLEQHFHSSHIWEMAIEEHRAVLRAIEVHDPRAARAAMARHVKNARMRMTSAWSKASDGPLPVDIAP